MARGAPQLPPGARPLLLRPPLYVRRWHVVNDWARELVEDFARHAEEKAMRTTRVQAWHGSIVRDEFDDEEAYKRGEDLANVWVPFGPDQSAGGRRRVVLRVLTWIPDDAAEVGYDSQWITTGQGFSARSASGAHNRYVQSYGQAVARGVESRRLLATALEVLFWTTGPTASYV